MTDIKQQVEEAERHAWDSLARYKFVMFGYWAGVWVHLNRLTPEPLPNPFKRLVDHGKEVMAKDSRFND